jgi:hypothetical protein
VKADITEEEVAAIYRRLFLCRIQHKKTHGIVQTMRSFAAAYELLYDIQHVGKHVYHTLWYNDARIYELEV